MHNEEFVKGNIMWLNFEVERIIPLSPVGDFQDYRG